MLCLGPTTWRGEQPSGNSMLTGGTAVPEDLRQLTSQRVGTVSRSSTMTGSKGWAKTKRCVPTNTTSAIAAQSTEDAIRRGGRWGVLTTARTYTGTRILPAFSVGKLASATEGQGSLTFPYAACQNRSPDDEVELVRTASGGRKPVTWCGVVAALLPLLGTVGTVGAESLTALSEQLLAASQRALAAERAARLCERAAQKIADAIRAERRAVWLERTAEALRERGGREYLAARRGADLARRERAAVVSEARQLTRNALEALDGLLEIPAVLEHAAGGLPRDLVSLSERLAEKTAHMRSAALAVREALLELQAVHVRMELTRDRLTEQRARRIEESLARHQAALADALVRLVETGEALTRAGEDLQRAASVPGVRERLGPRVTRRRAWGVGVGLGFNIDVGGKTRVDTARIVRDPATGGEVVRVDRTRTDVPRVVAEAHYLFPLGRGDGRSCQGPATRNDDGKETSAVGCGAEEAVSRIGAGPFLALQPGDDFIDAVGAGLMLGIRTGALFPDDRVQIGVGYFADPNTRVLGDGFAPNKPPPPGETQVRYKDVTKSGILVLLTYGF